jgi:hypothetical protein
MILKLRSRVGCDRVGLLQLPLFAAFRRHKVSKVVPMPNLASAKFAPIYETMPTPAALLSAIRRRLLLLVF